MRRYNSWVKKHIKPQSGKNILITGATGGIAFYIIDYLLELNANVIMAVRNKAKGETRMQELLKLHPNGNISLEVLDISKFSDFKGFIENIESKYQHIDVLINNAGIYHLKPNDNEYGMELHFATNFFGPTLHTEMMLPLLHKSNGKIITMGSIAYYFSKLDLEDIYAKKVKNRTKIYGKTKKLLMLEALQLKSNGENISIVQPGITASTLFDTLHGGFSSLFGKIIVPIMHLIFFSPSKAALSCIYALDKETKNNTWIGPRGLFHVWGYPKENKLRKNILDGDLIGNVDSIYQELKKKVME